MIALLCQFAAAMIFSRERRKLLRMFFLLAAFDIACCGAISFFIQHTAPPLWSTVIAYYLRYSDAQTFFYHKLWQLALAIFAVARLAAANAIGTAVRRREQARSELQAEMYNHQLAIMQESQSQIELVRHDMKNHLLHVRQLAARGDTAALCDYLQQTDAQLSHTQMFVSTGNSDLDMLLNFKLLRIQQLGAEITTNVQIPADMCFSAFDSSIIFGNLLDNAAEALQQTDNRKIRLALRYDAGMLYILVQNTCAGEPPAASQKGAGHGLGLHSVRRTIEAYSGELKTSYHDHVFTAAVILYL